MGKATFRETKMQRLNRKFLTKSVIKIRLTSEREKEELILRTK